MKFSERDFLKPYIIVDIGVNHEGDFSRALRLIDQARAGGAHAAKFQTYKAEKLAAKQSPAYWDQSKEPATSQRALFERYDSFDKEEYHKLAQHCEEVDIDFLSTPFDLDCLEWLVPLMGLVKIASADITNLPLIKACAQYGKPLVMSTGASTDAEVSAAIKAARESGAKDISLLHCVLNYPTPIDHAYLTNIQHLEKVFGNQVESIGYSDHVPPDACGNLQLIMAVMQGVTVLEKHFTDDKLAPGNDHYHAVDEADLRKFNERLGEMRALWGDSIENMLSSQQNARKFARRSLYYTGDLAAGTVLQPEHFIAKRPAAGITPGALDSLVGKTLVKAVKDDELVSIEHIE